MLGAVPPQSVAAGLPGRHTLPLPPPAPPGDTTGTRSSGLLINQGRAGGSQSPVSGGVCGAPASRANTALSPQQTQGKEGWALPAPGSALTATLKTTSSSILGLTHLKSSSPLPCPVKGSCRLNYNICNCANSS